MPVLDPSELQASSLADLHAIADQLGLEGFRRLRKADLIDVILGRPDARQDGLEQAPAAASADREAQADERPQAGGAASERAPRRRRPARSRRPRTEVEAEQERGGRRGRSEVGGGGAEDGGRIAEGVVELLGNGSAFVRVDPPEASDEDVYISAAQVRRCELVSGDRVTGPVRMPRRSERYPSLIRIEEINGAPAGEVSEGARYDERPVAYPSERLALDSGDATLEAIEWLTPFGRGSRAVIAGPARSGKTELLRRLLAALAGREGLEVTLVLAGVRPEEIAEWSEGPVAPVVALSFAASSDAQGQAVEHAIETAKRTAARGADALVLIDTLDGLHPHAARKTLAAARDLRDGGSLTILATAGAPLGGETTVIALDPELAGTGGPPLDLVRSGTVRAELLVGEDGAKAIAEARAAAMSQP
ncbi:MAG TPA: Rho termination factor N-terminal domain-containing protein [Solirubrobacteraceae bacterium]|nr:Rho termination factor N-terminal domain-containing protein [Solirubrobacteraceae bacterium]